MLRKELFIGYKIKHKTIRSDSDTYYEEFKRQQAAREHNIGSKKSGPNDRKQYLNTHHHLPDVKCLAEKKW